MESNLNNENNVFARLKSGEDVLCPECGKTYLKPPENVSCHISKEFRCKECGCTYRYTPNIIVE